jgi:hypothetical protein
MRIRTILAAAAAPLALGAILLTAGQASAATVPGTVSANTHLNQNPDTTTASGGATIAENYGSVWAFDNLTMKFTAVPVTGTSDGANYFVTIDFTGSYHGFADPTTGLASTSDGSVKGTIEYDVASNGLVPSAANLASQYAPNLATGTPALTDLVNDLFGGTVQTVGGGAYSFSYQNGNYTQVQLSGTGIAGHGWANGSYTPTGDVQGH